MEQCYQSDEPNQKLINYDTSKLFRYWPIWTYLINLTLRTPKAYRFYSIHIFSIHYILWQRIPINIELLQCLVWTWASWLAVVVRASACHWHISWADLKCWCALILALLLTFFQFVSTVTDRHVAIQLNAFICFVNWVLSSPVSFYLKCFGKLAR